jgi:Skp family chaperone for outer membrane proteins
MIKRIVMLSVVSLLLVGTSFAQIAPKIAIVDMNDVLKNYYKTQDVETRLKDVASGYQKDLNDRREAYSKLLDQIHSLQDEAKDPSLSDAKKKEKEAALEDKVKDARVREQENANFIRTASGLLAEQRSRDTQNIMDDISKAIQAVSKAKGYNLVLAKTDMPSAVLYSDISDISADVVKELNKDKPAGKSDKK